MSSNNYQRILDNINQQAISFVDTNVPENTLKKANQSANLFKKYLASLNENRDVIEIEKSELAKYVNGWIMSMKPSKSTKMELEPSTINSYFKGLDRYLRDRNYTDSLRNEPEFQLVMKVLETKRKVLKSQGYGNRPNRCDSLDDCEIDLLWEKGIFGYTSAKQVQYTIFYYLGLTLGFRATHEHRQLKLGDLIGPITDANGDKYVQFTERLTKTRHGQEDESSSRIYAPKMWQAENRDRCPVKAFEIFKNHRPSQMKSDDSPFYLAFNNSTFDNAPWFKNQNLGQHSLEKIMKICYSAAGLSGKFINNTSIRKTTATKLLNAKIPAPMVQGLTGHKTAESLSAYACTTVPVQKEMCNVLTGTKRRYNETVTSSSTVVSEKISNKKSNLSGMFINPIFNNCKIIMNPVPAKVDFNDLFSGIDFDNDIM